MDIQLFQHGEPSDFYALAKDFCKAKEPPLLATLFNQWISGKDYNLDVEVNKITGDIKKLEEKLEKLEGSDPEIKRVGVEIIAHKILQLSHMRKTLGIPGNKTDRELLKKINASYLLHLSKLGEVYGDDFLTDRALLQTHVEKWGNSLDKLQGLYKQKIDLEIASPPETDKKALLIWKYQLAYIDLNIQTVERKLIDQLKDKKFELIAKNNALRNAALTSMRNASAELKKYSGRRAFEEIRQKQWTYTPWGEALVSAREAEPENMSLDFLSPFSTPETISFEKEIEGLKKNIRRLKGAGEGKREELREAKLELAEKIYSSILSAWSPENTEALQPKLEKCRKDMVSLLSEAPNQGKWVSAHVLNQSFLGAFQGKPELENRYLRPLFAECEALCKSEDAEEIPSKQMSLLAHQRHIAKEIGLDESLLANNNQESEKIAKHTPGLWESTAWGEILINEKPLSAAKWLVATVFATEYRDKINAGQRNMNALTEELKELDPAKENEKRRENLTTEIHEQELHLLQTHLHKITDWIGERMKEINDLKGKEPERVKIAQSEIEILTNKHDEFLTQYKEKYSKRNVKEFTLGRLLLSQAKELLPFQEIVLASPTALEKKMQFAAAGYSMGAEVEKFFSNIGKNLTDEADASVVLNVMVSTLKEEVKGFLAWAETNSSTASQLAGDIMQVCGVLQQEGLITQIQQGLRGTLYTKALLAELHGELPATEKIDEKAFRYHALADLLRSLPAITGALTGAAQSAWSLQSIGVMTPIRILWGAFQGGAGAKMAQNLRDIIPPDLQQVALMAADALKGKSVQGIIEEQRNIEVVNLGAKFVRRMNNPQEFVEDVKDWWKKIQRSSGTERAVRVATQMGIPVASTLASAAVIFSATPAGAATAALLFGTTGPVGIVVAIAVLGVLLPLTFSTMILMNQLIDTAAYSQATLRKLAIEKAEKNPVFIKEIEDTRDRYLKDLRKTQQIPPEDEIIDHPLLSNSHVKSAMHDLNLYCTKELADYWDGLPNKNIGLGTLVSSFNEKMSIAVLKEQAKNLLDEHTKNLASPLLGKIEKEREVLLEILAKKARSDLTYGWLKDRLGDVMKAHAFATFDTLRSPEDYQEYIRKHPQMKQEDLEKAYTAALEKNLENKIPEDAATQILKTITD